MRDIIIGTAGHVDHGKTALIEAMTGYNGDEMAEEKERGITIDLSFSNMEQEGVNVAFIDVPGHEKLIKNMISGAFGFDAALLVIAVDDGIMPQTLEHFNVLRIAGVHRVVVALNKSDLADADLLDRRTQEIEALFAEHPTMELLSILPTSIHRPETIAALKETLFSLPPRQTPDAPFFRYYIDRVFSPRGVGTVVTGTVLAGTVTKGAKLNVAELNKPVTIRNIQVHGRDQESAHTHQRVAFNLDLSHQKLSKGFLLCSRGYFRGFATLDVALETIGEAGLTHGADVLFISGAKRVEGTVLLYPDSGYATLKLREKVFTQFGDPFVLLASGRLIAGGAILIPISEPMRKRQKLTLLRALKVRDFAQSFALLLANHRRGFGLISSHQHFGIDHAAALTYARSIEGAFVDEAGLVVYPLKALTTIHDAIHAIYEHNPRAFLSPASVILRITWASEALVGEVMRRMVAEGYLKQTGSIYLRADQDEKELIHTLEERILAILDDEGLTPEAPYNLYDRLDLDRTQGDQALKSLTRRKKVIRLAHNLFVTETHLTRALATMREIITAQGYIDIRTFKATTSMSRKYCIAYLEYLDASDTIVNEGNRRRFRYT